jgi:hypothetical protein
VKGKDKELARHKLLVGVYSVKSISLEVDDNSVFGSRVRENEELCLSLLEEGMETFFKE